jgi:DNA-binding response OmpR family regulator
LRDTGFVYRVLLWEFLMIAGKKHILIADSDEIALIKLEQMFEDDGFSTTTAWSTSETVDLLGRQQFDLLLVADHPPELNCEAVLYLKRKSGSSVPLVVMETKPRHPFAEPFLMNLGASRIVHKTQPGEVLAAVEFILAESSGISSKRPIAAAAKVG